MHAECNGDAAADLHLQLGITTAYLLRQFGAPEEREENSSTELDRLAMKSMDTIYDFNVETGYLRGV